MSVNDQDWALIQAVENARLLRRSETRKMEAQVSTKCLMRADDRRQKDAIKRIKQEQEAAAKVEVLPGGVKPKEKRSMMGKASHKRDRAMRRMYNDLTQEEIDEMNASATEKKSPKKKKKKKNKYKTTITMVEMEKMVRMQMAAQRAMLLSLVPRFFHRLLLSLVLNQLLRKWHKIRLDPPYQ